MQSAHPEKYPDKLARIVELFRSIEDRAERMEMLISYSERFSKAPEEIAQKPFPLSCRVPNCESEVYIWASRNEDGTLKFWFVIENPQGLSSMAMAVILDETLSGTPLDQIINMPSQHLANCLFGNELSVGKNLGLTSMIHLVQSYAKNHLES